MRFGSLVFRQAVRLSSAAVRFATRDASRCDPHLLEVVWESLNIARDNKALVLAKEGTILNINALALQLCGRSESEMLGKCVTTQLFEDTPRQSVASRRWETALKTANHSIPVEVVCQSLARLQGVAVYALRDLRGRREAAENRERQSKTLQQQKQQLDVALNNMSQGLCLFDADQRVVIANRRYADMYGLPLGLIEPGTTLRQLLEARARKGFYENNKAKQWVETGVSNFNKEASDVLPLSDGRLISVQRRLVAGGGVVSTHEDVTEREKLRERLDAALSHMVQGLAMFDGELRLVLANERYAEVYGLEPAQVKPGMHLREIVEHRVAKGHYGAKTVDEVVEPMLARAAGQDASHHVVELPDRRFVAVSVQPMANGGRVTTHHDITEQRRSEAKIAHMARHDALTGLPNRAFLNERLEQALARRSDIVATHILDLDRFKHVNDTLGHPVGDVLLQMVADRLRSLVRDTDTIARMGGDEFVIVQAGLPQVADATSLAGRVIAALSEPFDIDGHHVVIGTSVGIAIGPSNGETPDELVKNADLALYRAKSDGRGTFRFFEPDMDSLMQSRRILEQDLRKALAGGELELHYQPVVNLDRNEISGCEALIRWRHPGRGMVSPTAFIPLAEEIGLIVPLGEWVIRQACTTAARWPGKLKVAVNLSPAQFRSPGLLQVIVGALASSGLPANRLELEVTETILLQDSDTTLDILYRLRELGVRIAMDDFGTGYSSLSYLQRFPFDKIKIDRSFIGNIVESASSLNIVRAVAALASGLGVTATAEGVETQAQLETIKLEGCTEMQGFLFSKPLPADAVEKLILSKQAALHDGVAAA
jgi:diguanylate cyclase (GGDEF)-like protein